MSKNILASIVIPVYNKVEYTKECIETLVRNVSPIYFNNKNADYELIVVDNASTDGTEDFLRSIGGSFKYIRNKENLGFSKACNIGAKAAIGKYVVLLNNDTHVPPLWLENLIDFMEATPDAGACGSKLVHGDGGTQEAGGIMFRDGTALNFGEYEDPNSYKINQVCEVDYCSGASLCVRKDLWDKMGGLDEETFSPAYYEDSDLCFQVRKQGYKVYYVPTSILKHFGNVTSASMPNNFLAENMKRNKERFVNKWKDELSKHLEYKEQALPTQDRNVLLDPIFQKNFNANKKLLMYFSFSLLPISSGVQARVFDIIQAFQKIGFEVNYVSSNLYDERNNDETLPNKLLVNYGIKSFIHKADKSDDCYKRGIGWKRTYAPSLKAYFKDVYNEIKPDVVVVNYAYDADVIDLNLCKNSVNIIDMNDALTISNSIMDYTNVAVEALKNSFGKPNILNIIKESKFNDFLDIDFIHHQKKTMDQEELDVYDTFDITLAISKKEEDMVTEGSKNKNAFFLPQIFKPKDITSSYADYPIFIVGPSALNTQAYLFFALKVLPLILKEEPNFKLKVFGKASLNYQKFDGIELMGFVENLDDIYKNAPFAISPLLSGTGQQIKVVESMAYGVPVVMFDCLQESAPITSGKEGFIAKDEYDFAKYCLKLFNDRKLAFELGQNAKEKTGLLYNEKKKYYSDLYYLIEEKKAEKLNSISSNSKFTTEIKVIDAPLVSVIMPAYNKAKYLKESIESVMLQDYPNVELIIVNDGSTDNSLSVLESEIKKYPHKNIRLYSKDNLGVAHTRNYGFFRAKGDYFMNFDADDILQASYISKCIRQLEKDNADVCFSDLELFGNKTSEWIPSDYSPQGIRYENSIPSSAIFKSIFYTLTKGQKVALGFSEDWEFWVNMSRYGIKVTRVREKLFRYRVIDDGIAETYINNAYNDTLLQVVLNNADLYLVSDVIKCQGLIPYMKPKAIESIYRLNKKHPSEWYPYFVIGVLEESKNNMDKALKCYSLASKLSYNSNIVPLMRWAYLKRTFELCESDIEISDIKIDGITNTYNNISENIAHKLL
ncbi:MAG: glycosyltransferase [Bdellovibrionota bacterium]